MKRFLLMLLVCAMLAGCFAGCGMTGDRPGDTTASSQGGDVIASDQTAVTEKAETSLYDADGYLKDSLPERLDYGLEEIQILYWNNGELGPGEFDPGEDETGFLQKSVYTRNMVTEDRLNVVLQWKGVAGTSNDRTTFFNTVAVAFSGGDATRLDLIAGYSLNMATLAVQGFTKDLMTSSKYLSLEKPWWPDSLVNDLTISGKLYFASGDISTSFIGTMLSVFVNKAYYPDQNLYDLVYNDQWTLETMCKMVKDKRFDRGELDKKDVEDRFGLVVGWTGYLDGFLYGSDLITVDHDAKGELHVNSDYVGEKADTLCETLKTLFGSDDAWMPGPNDPDSLHKDAINLFAAGEVAMMVGTGTTILVYDSMLNTRVNYAVLPMPKYDENQKDYKSVNLNLYTLWSIFGRSDALQAERAGAVMECLGATGYRTVSPLLLEKCLKVRYANDEDTGKMYDIIRAGVVFDPGRIFASGALGGLPQEKWQRSVIFNSSWGAQSMTVDSQLQDKLDALSESFRNNTENSDPD